MRTTLFNVRDPRWCSSWQAALALLLLCAAVYVPGLTALPTIDRDEARFAQASRQMFQSLALPASQRNPDFHSGGLIIPMIQDRPRLNKPPLIYWLQSASAALCTAGDPSRDAIWMYRFPSTLAAFASVLLLWRLGLSMFDPRAAFLAAVMLAVCPLFVWEARQARADHVLTASTLAAMSALWNIWRRTPSSHGPRHSVQATRSTRPTLLAPAFLWISLSLAILTKGPIAPMIAVLACLSLSVLNRRWSWLRATRPILGLAILTASLTPWILLLADRFGLANYLALVYDETLDRAAYAQEQHAGPPGYHLVLLIVMLWPGSLVTGMAVCRAWSRTIRGLTPWTWRPIASTRSRAAELFCLAWILPAWLVFELSATKLPHYVMPLFPPLALLSARTLLAASAAATANAAAPRTAPRRFPAASGRLATTVYVLWIGVTAAAVAILAASLLLFDASWTGPLPLAILTATSLLLVQVCLIARVAFSIARRKPARAFRAALAIAVILWVTSLGMILPRAPSLWPTAALARSLRSIDPTSSRPLATLYHEDSLIFDTRGRAIRLDTPDRIAPFLALHPDALIILRQSDLPAHPELRPLAYIRGFNLARFARERLAIAHAIPIRPPQPPPADARPAAAHIPPLEAPQSLTPPQSDTP